MEALTILQPEYSRRFVLTLSQGPDGVPVLALAARVGGGIATAARSCIAQRSGRASRRLHESHAPPLRAPLSTPALRDHALSPGIQCAGPLATRLCRLPPAMTVPARSGTADAHAQLS